MGCLRSFCETHYPSQPTRYQDLLVRLPDVSCHFILSSQRLMSRQHLQATLRLLTTIIITITSSVKTRPRSVIPPHHQPLWVKNLNTNSDSHTFPWAQVVNIICWYYFFVTEVHTYFPLHSDCSHSCHYWHFCLSLSDPSSSSNTAGNQDALCSFSVELDHQQIAINQHLPLEPVVACEASQSGPHAVLRPPRPPHQRAGPRPPCNCRQPTFLWLVPTVVSPWKLPMSVCKVRDIYEVTI